MEYIQSIQWAATEEEWDVARSFVDLGHIIYKFNKKKPGQIGLKWEYCECGCHGHEASKLGKDFWMFNDLGQDSSGKIDTSKAKFYLNSGHGWMGTKIGVYSSFDEADDVATNMLNSYVQKEMKE